MRHGKESGNVQGSLRFPIWVTDNRKGGAIEERKENDGVYIGTQRIRGDIIIAQCSRAKLCQFQ